MQGEYRGEYGTGKLEINEDWGRFESAMDKPIIFSKHSKLQRAERGASETEVIKAIKIGEEVPAK